jgi:ParB family chromosome partitioning protein
MSEEALARKKKVPVESPAGADAVRRRPAALGRGLGALLGESRREESLTPVNPSESKPVEGMSAEGLVQIAIADIDPHPGQPRRHFDDGALQELADSIASRGVIQPIIVRPLGRGKYQIVAGERRWRAAQRARLHEIPAIVRALDEDEVMTLALIENLQREDLNPVVSAACGRAGLVSAGNREVGR